MTSAVFFNIAAGAYVIALMSYVIYLVTKKNTMGIMASSMTGAGFISHTIAFVIRWVNSYDFWLSSHPNAPVVEAILRAAPLRNLYESLIFFVWSLILIYLIIEVLYKNRSLGAFVTPIAAAALLFIDISGTSKEIQPLIPALQSNWLLFHVFLAFIGYAAFGVSFGAATAYVIVVTESKKESSYIFCSLVIGLFLAVLIGMGIDFASLSVAERGNLIQNHFLTSTLRSESSMVSTISWLITVAFVFSVWYFGLGLKKVLASFDMTHEMLDDIAYKSIAIGFPLFTIGGLIMGAIWANSAWGTYWSWDPKETWSLITWFVYALYLHARYVGGWRGKKVAVLAVVGFIAVIATYLGVNLVLSGLHSYGGG
ncbi:c-type cytochrome biogenesis protein CcsB [bacterium]|nr:c-type cytochrome biogenesis protein CcsB [bacterium]